MCDLICDVITSSVEAAIRVKSTHLIKSYVKTRNKIENMEIRIFLHKTPSIRSFRHKINVKKLNSLKQCLTAKRPTSHN